MRFWQPFVFLRYVLFMIVGILLGEYIDWPHTGYVSVFLAVCLTAYTAAFFFYRNNEYRYRLLGVLGLLVFTAFGLWRTVDVSQLHEPHHYRHQLYKTTAFEVVLYQQPTLTPSGMKAEANIKQIKTENDGWQPAEGKILLRWFALDSTLQYGDRLLIAGRPDTVKASSNPEGLDYKAYLFRKQIYALRYLYDQTDYARSGYDPPLLVMAFAIKARQFCQQQINMFVEPEAQPLMEALLLGVKDRLSIEVREAFSAAGAMHVLAVSGLHVGIIFTVILFLLRPFNTTTAGKWGVLVVSLLALWLYAFVTGLAPSVMRAALMFSVLAVGERIFKQRDAYNTLALSAFVLLFWNPWLVFNMGFQFSYLAVLGILYIQPKIDRLYMPRNNWLEKYLWGGFTVSLAAQIAVSPLSLAYFHQFPAYFLFTNVVALGVAFLLVNGGVFFLIVSSLHQALLLWIQSWDWFWIEIIMAWLISKTVNFLEYSMKWAESLAGSVWYIGWISKENVPYIYFALFMLFVALQLKKTMYIRAAFVALAVAAGLQIEQILKDHQDKLTVYATGHKASAVSLISGGELKGFVQDFSDDKQLWHFAVQEHWKKLTASQTDTVEQGEESVNTRFYGGIRWLASDNGQLTAMIYEPSQLPPLAQKIRLDRLVVGNEAVSGYDLKELTQTLSIKELIIEESYSARQADYLAEAAQKLGIQVHDIRTGGAYVAALE